MVTSEWTNELEPATENAAPLLEGPAVSISEHDPQYKPPPDSDVSAIAVLKGKTWLLLCVSACPHFAV